MRVVYDTTLVNIPRTIAGLPWKIFVGIYFIFGFVAATYRLPEVLVPPLLLHFFLSGPGKRDPEFLSVHIKHRSQRERYSPAYVALPNDRLPRPDGFNRDDAF
jgi:hypothetical protein